MQYNEDMSSPVNKTTTAPPLEGTVFDLAVQDVQRRLAVLGYELGDEVDKGLYGEKTLAAISAFKASTQLPEGELLDQATWIALVDASLTMGERSLYLHRPYFQGRDVVMLQGALSSLGFSLAVDGIFGPGTECAVRDFQTSMELPDKGIVGEETFVALQRLRHAWEGKAGVRLEGRSCVPVRDPEILKVQNVCVFGVTEMTRSVAERISNLAHATCEGTKVVSASSLTRPPAKGAWVVGLTEVDALGDITFAEEIEAALVAGLAACSEDECRIELKLASRNTEYPQVLWEQYAAATILDALCDELGKRG
jgi:peptidoglycan hydrolase-like protein with peptidoglycan-binding domain